MLARSMTWEDAMRYYDRGTLNRAEMFQCGLEYISRAQSVTDGMMRVSEVGAYFNSRMVCPEDSYYDYVS